MELNTIINDDCLEALKRMPENCIDTVITDPPYGLSFMGKKWDYDIPSVEIFEQILRVLKPGGTLLCFGGTRTYHRIAVNIEDAGFELRDCLMWLYGSGFPKIHNISKAIDKHFGEEREVVGKANYKSGTPKNSVSYPAGRPDITAPATDEAAQFEGYSTALKPAWEPIVCAIKPIEGTYAENALKWGVAGFNIDECRIGTEDKDYFIVDHSQNYGKSMFNANQTARGGGHENGRYPSNLLLTHHEECEYVGSEEVKNEAYRENGKSIKGKYHKKATWGVLGTGEVWSSPTETVSRYNCHPECPVKQLDEQAGECGANGLKHKKGPREKRNTYNLPFIDEVYNKSKGPASRFFYTGKAYSTERGEYNNHPTVKPIELMRYLCRLTKTPAGGVVLDPFSGSGSTLLAAKIEGRQYIGIEREKEYVDIANKRLNDAELIQYILNQSKHDSDYVNDQIIQPKNGQGSLF
jgi:site-specific DNA-methyltransferase (adenine-specific)